MRVGAATLSAIVEIEELRAPPQFFVSDLTDTEIAELPAILDERFFESGGKSCRVSQHAWLIETADKRILVDPCVGHQRDRPRVPMFHQIDSPFIAQLASFGVTPESIDYVFCTHLHLDHVGWNTRLEDGRFVPTFANARYLFSPDEERYWREQPLEMLPGDEFNAGVYAECIAPVIEAGLADIAETGMRIAECLTLIAAPGHTPGHMAGLLESAGEGAVLAGDAIHHPLHVLYPDRPFIAYNEAAARKTRRELLDLCAERDYWLAPAHFCAPHACKIRKAGGGYAIIWD
jgi:glyoxylase-like metal-dependent hydrolase (beta-lactamase superfamily II)